MNEPAVPDDHDQFVARPHPPLDRRRLTMLLGPVAVLIVANQIGVALAPTLVNEHPVWLLALSPLNRHLALIAGRIQLVPLYLVGTLRLMAPDPFFYLLGFFYGERAIAWMEQRTASVGSMMRRLERLFGRFGHALVFVMPNNYVCLIAGGSGMPTAVFWTLNLSGTVARITMFRWFGMTFQDQIDGVLRFIADYRPWILAVTVGIVILSAARELRSGSSELQQLAELEDQLEEVEDDHRALIDEDRKRREDDR